MLLLVFTLCFANMLFAVGVVCLPLLDQGPHITHGWGQVVRLRHLYAAKNGMHLLINEDGQIHGSADQNLHSLMEIQPVGPGCVVIKGVATRRFLCIEHNGRLYTLSSYNTDECTFREQILPDGYNTYSSVKYGVLLSLGSHRQRLQGRDQDVPALAQFLPRISTLDLGSTPGLEVQQQPEPTTAQVYNEEAVDMLDSFGKLSQIIQSPSFNKR
ncbi:fibroblast growth factor 19-like [Thalassophryne amazonica]|uniref:fibroblast growth factor 19-like n=1 Tax=Thalassophryne amazonica TaxID=390379 RepID=UPI001472580D|nr:fibroblast growth factor 19-like [Thalassophryne amazonica]XP_034039675.1 fibroblast growth factor 19-like [Thalassophryne amazonica]